MYLDLLKLTGRIALVTGGGRGIGLACAEALAEAGARLTIADRDASLADQGRMTLRAKGYDADTVIMDVANSGRVTQVADEVVARYGRIDNGTFWCCRAFGSHMLQAQSGAIVNIGSMSGFIVNKPQEQSYYNASKAAVHHLTKSLAAEWAARGVRVNAVAPTYIATPLTAFVESDPVMYDAWITNTPMARLGRVEEIASVVLFLASDAASLMTGSIVLADGGYTCW